MNVPVNHSAPVYHSEEITINAPVEQVWDILTKIDEWPEWQAAVSEARLDGSLREGATFKWKAAGTSLTSQIHTIRQYREFGWTGKAIGTSAVHNWYFADLGGQTKLRVEESLEGFLPKLLKGFFQKTLAKGMRTSLEELKHDAENP